MNTSTLNVLADIFPIETKNLPKLFSYELNISGSSSVNEIGRSLQYNIPYDIVSNCAWSNKSRRLITDSKIDEKKIEEHIHILWSEKTDKFQHLVSIALDENRVVNSDDISTFTNKCLLKSYKKKVETYLETQSLTIKDVTVKINYKTIDQSVENQPSIAILVDSKLIYNKDLKEYIANNGDTSKILVFDKNNPDFKGKITKKVGILRDNRSRLKALTKNQNTIQMLDVADDNEIIVQMNNKYDYAVSSLGVILTVESLKYVNTNSSQIIKKYRLSPSDRRNIINGITKILKRSKLYNLKEYPELFLSSDDIGFKSELLFANKNIRIMDNKNLAKAIYDFGIYKKNEKFNDKPIIISILDARNNPTQTVFREQLENEIKKFGFQVKMTGFYKVENCTRSEFEIGIENLEERSPDLILGLFDNENPSDEDENDAYNIFKSITVGRGIPSQALYHSTLDNKYSISNIVIGIIGKTGNIPFILSNPIEYADVIVGLDVARQKKEKLSGSINATAIARIYFNNGEFLKYSLYDAPLEGETIPKKVLESLFPSNKFKNKKILIHRDGRFTSEERKYLTNWGKEISSEFYFVEIIKTGSPRLYSENDGIIDQPSKSTIFKFNDNECLLISSLPPFKSSLPLPLRIKTYDGFCIKKACHSILSLTLLHYGSIKQPRLPVSTHYSDKIGYMALKGIKPRDLEGSMPFWL